MEKKEKTNQILFAVYLLMLTCYMVLAQLSTVMQAVRSDETHWEESFSSQELFVGGSRLCYMGLLILLAFAWTTAAGSYFEQNWIFHIPKRPSKWLLLNLLLGVVGFILCVGCSTQRAIFPIVMLWAVLLGITIAILFFHYEKKEMKDGYDREVKGGHIIYLRAEKIAEAMLWECGALTCRCITLFLLPNSFIWPIVRMIGIVLFLLGIAWMLNEIAGSVRNKKS